MQHNVSSQSFSRPRAGEAALDGSAPPTPHQPYRGFLGSQSFVHNISRMQERPADPQTGVFIQGTLLEMNEVQREVREFLVEFVPGSERLLSEERARQGFYLSEILQLVETETFSLVVDARHVYEFSKGLYFKLVWYPSEIIYIFDLQATECLRALGAGRGPAAERSVLTTVIGLREVAQIRGLPLSQINHLVALRGVVVRCSEVFPEMKAGHFRCAACGAADLVAIERGQIRQPAECRGCRAKHSQELVHNLCVFTDRQIVRLQETPDQVEEGGLPAHTNLLVYDSLVDSCKPGDAVEVIGIYRAQPVRVHPTQRSLHALFRTYIDVVSVTYAHDSRVAIDGEAACASQQTFFSEAEVAEFRQLAARPDLCALLLGSFAPSILELDDVKKGLLCQLFGGAPKSFDPAFKARFRNELNVLLIGDPSTAKSQLLQAVHKLSPRGVFTSGKGSSAVGLTAYITTDSDTREMVLESGALVLSDHGICCIDEFDKMDEGTAGILHEVMEQQTISIAKAGIVCSLNARTAVLAAANPRESRYNHKRSIVYNLQMPPSILSRFDLIYIMLDHASAATDVRLAMHILSLYSPEGAAQPRPRLDADLLKKFVLYARLNCVPALTEEAGAVAVRSYLDMRRQGSSRNTITATPRQLESVLRIAEALAKMRLAAEVAVGDVLEAARLVREATQAAAYDPLTGQIDMNVILTGYSSSLRDRVTLLAEELRRKLHSHEEVFRRGYLAAELRHELQAALQQQGREQWQVSGEELLLAVRTLEDEKRVNIIGDTKSEAYTVKALRA